MDFTTLWYGEHYAHRSARPKSNSTCLTHDTWTAQRDWIVVGCSCQISLALISTKYGATLHEGFGKSTSCFYHGTLDSNWITTRHWLVQVIHPASNGVSHLFINDGKLSAEFSVHLVTCIRMGAMLALFYRQWFRPLFYLSACFLVIVTGRGQLALLPVMTLSIVQYHLRGPLIAILNRRTSSLTIPDGLWKMWRNRWHFAISGVRDHISGGHSLL